METKKDRIERLKKNEVLYGRLSQDDKDTMHDVGFHNLVWWSGTEWVALGETRVCSYANVYRINQDYQFDPFHKVPVNRSEGTYDYKRPCDDVLLGIEHALSDENFMYYEYEDGRKCMEPRRPSGDGVSGPALFPKYVVFQLN